MYCYRLEIKKELKNKRELKIQIITTWGAFLFFGLGRRWVEEP
jgi:hypothetical protein